jgi:hypothetical protein
MTLNKLVYVYSIEFLRQYDIVATHCASGVSDAMPIPVTAIWCLVPSWYSIKSQNMSMPKLAIVTRDFSCTYRKTTAQLHACKNRPPVLVILIFRDPRCLLPAS